MKTTVTAEVIVSLEVPKVFHFPLPGTAALESWLPEQILAFSVRWLTKHRDQIIAAVIPKLCLAGQVNLAQVLEVAETVEPWLSKSEAEDKLDWSTFPKRVKGLPGLAGCTELTPHIALRLILLGLYRDRFTFIETMIPAPFKISAGKWEMLELLFISETVVSDWGLKTELTAENKSDWDATQIRRLALIFWRLRLLPGVKGVGVESSSPAGARGIKSTGEPQVAA